jgi:hypothetical protein
MSYAVNIVIPRLASASRIGWGLNCACACECARSSVDDSYSVSSDRIIHQLHLAAEYVGRGPHLIPCHQSAAQPLSLQSLKCAPNHVDTAEDALDMFELQRKPIPATEDDMDDATEAGQD